MAPETNGGSVVVDTTQDVQLRLESKERANSALQWGSKEGQLCLEDMRGIRLSLSDVTMHAGVIHRGVGQIMPPNRNCCFAIEMMAKPTL